MKGHEEISRVRNAEAWLRRVADIERQFVRPSELHNHQVQIRENREAALRDLNAARTGADADELAVINAAIVKIEGKAEAKPAQVTKKGTS
jgi:hypothetical protein